MRRCHPCKHLRAQLSRQKQSPQVRKGREGRRGDGKERAKSWRAERWTTEKNSHYCTSSGVYHVSDKLTAGLLKILSLNIRKLGLANCLKHKSEDEQYKFCGVGHWLVIQCEHKVLGNL